MNYLVLTLVAFILTAIVVPLGLPFLKRLKFGQFVRDDGPQSHLAKQGTPTMGGLLFIFVIVVVGGIASIFEPQLLPVILMMIGFGVVGFVDDYIKVVKKRSLGFKAYQKMLAQILITGMFVAYCMMTMSQPTMIIIPFLSGVTVDLGWLYIPFMFIFVLGTVNGVNLTDGIDGLSTSVTIAVLVFFLAVDQLMGTGIGSIMAIVIGALFAFLIYNSHPAALFMGDTGSLALGGLVAAIASMTRLPLIILLVGFIYLAEVISVMLQVSYYKKTKKRLFKMAPIHHHFELLGWKETKVVYVFSITTVMLCVLAYIGVVIYYL